MGVALTGLHFDRAKERDALMFDDPLKLPLGKVPPVLLCECWNDLRLIAGAGTGFDPEWEKKVY